MEKKTKVLQLAYGLILVIAVLIAVLSEMDILPVDYIGNEPKILYWMNLYAIFVAFGGMFVCLRMFVFKRVMAAIMNVDEQKAFAVYFKHTVIRLFIIMLALWSNTLLYFATSYSSTPQYCVLVTLVSCVFCWPSMSAFSGLRKANEEPADRK